MRNTIPGSYKLLERVACKASIMLEGLTGHGKSGVAIMLGFGLAGGFKEGVTPKEQAEIWKKIFAADTENNSLTLFPGIHGSFGVPFGKIHGFSLTSDIGYKPNNYIALREMAVEQGAEVWIADSITHMWIAKDGVLDLVNQTKAQLKNNTDNYRVWGTPEVMAEKQALMDVIRSDKVHVITTVRVKEKFDMSYDAATKKYIVTSLGEQQVQQDGLKYEPDLVLHCLKAGTEHEHPRVLVIKSRYSIFKLDQEYDLTPQLCEQLRQYLAEGVDADVLLKQQHDDYVLAIKNYLDSKQAAQIIWTQIKDKQGYKDVPLAEIPLAILKHLYGILIS